MADLTASPRPQAATRPFWVACRLPPGRPAGRRPKMVACRVRGRLTRQMAGAQGSATSRAIAMTKVAVGGGLASEIKAVTLKMAGAYR